MPLRVFAGSAAVLTLAVACALPSPGRKWPEPGVARTAPLPAGAPLVRIAHPAAQSVHAGDAPVFLTGDALAVRQSAPFDVVLVIDVSGSTREPADTVPSKPPRRFGSRERAAAREGSVLAVQVASARALLANLDPAIVRVAVVTFSGVPPLSTQGMVARTLSRQPPATTVLPLSHDRAAVETALDSILERGPWGLTNMAAGLKRAIAELLGGPGSASEFDLRTRKIIVFLTDGAPTLPYPGFPEDNVNAVLEEVDRAAGYGIRIHSYGIGPMALEGPLALVEMADRTDGSFVPVRDPGLLSDILPTLALGGVESIAVRNRTTREKALASTLHPDGRWEALVGLDPGANEIEIRARSSTGAEGEHRITLVRRLDAPTTALPPALAERRTALDTEALRRREALRVELQAEIERERQELGPRVEAQRKQLELAPAPAPAP